MNTTLEDAFAAAGYQPQADTPLSINDITVDQLDQLARRIQEPDRGQAANQTDEWLDAFTHHTTALCKLFSDDDGDEQILANKLVDYITHFFDRERQKIYGAATAEKAKINRLKDSGSEVDHSAVEDAARRIRQLREQYAVCNMLFLHMRDKVRHAVFAETGIRWNSAYRSDELNRLLNQRARIAKSLDANLLVVNRGDFDDRRAELDKIIAKIRAERKRIDELDMRINIAKRENGRFVAVQQRRTGRHPGNDIEHDRPAFDNTPSGRFDA